MTIAMTFAAGQYRPHPAAARSMSAEASARGGKRMVVAKRPLFIAAALAAAFHCGAAGAMIQPEIGRMTCALFLSDIATNPPSYQLYLTFVQGYLAAKVSSNDPAALRLNDGAVLLSVVSYCRGHAGENFDSAIAAAVRR
jgi:hypothetical protein